MLVRAAWNPKAPRYILGVLAMASLIHAGGTAALPYLTLWPWLWGGFFIVSALGCAWCAADLGNPVAVAVAGSATIVAYVMRGVVLLYGWTQHAPALRQFSALSIAAGVTVWWVTAFLNAVLFFRRVAPLAAEERQRN